MVNFANLPAETLISVCNFLRGDGHTIWKSEALLDAGLPPEYVESVSDTYESDGSIKGSIFGNDGDVLTSTTGVYGLTVYRRIAADLGLPPSTMSGRGFEARDLGKRIREHLQIGEQSE